MVAAFKMPVAPCSSCGHFESRGSVILYKGWALCSVHSQLIGKDQTGMTKNSLVLKSYLRESSSLGRSQDWAVELYLGRKQKAAFVLTTKAFPLYKWEGTRTREPKWMLVVEYSIAPGYHGHVKTEWKGDCGSKGREEGRSLSRVPKADCKYYSVIALEL